MGTWISHKAANQMQQCSVLETVPVFPLPNVVLLPGSLIPLHVFEQRYRALLSDVRASDGQICLATVKPDHHDEQGQPAIWPIVGVGKLVFDQLLPDGRSIIVVKGLRRARIVEEFDVDKPYRVMQTQHHPDTPISDPTHAQAQMELLLHHLRQVADRAPSDAGITELMRACMAHRDPGMMADIAGGALLTESSARLHLLNEQAPCRRLEIVNQFLVAALGQLDTRDTYAN